VDQKYICNSAPECPFNTDWHSDKCTRYWVICSMNSNVIVTRKKKWTSWIILLVLYCFFCLISWRFDWRGSLACWISSWSPCRHTSPKMYIAHASSPHNRRYVSHISWLLSTLVMTVIFVLQSNMKNMRSHSHLWNRSSRNHSSLLLQIYGEHIIQPQVQRAVKPTAALENRLIKIPHKILESQYEITKRRLETSEHCFIYTLYDTSTRWGINSGPPSFKRHNLVNVRFIYMKISGTIAKGMLSQQR